MTISICIIIIPCYLCFLAGWTVNVWKNKGAAPSVVAQVVNNALAALTDNNASSCITIRKTDLGGSTVTLVARNISSEDVTVRLSHDNLVCWGHQKLTECGEQATVVAREYNDIDASPPGPNIHCGPMCDHAATCKPENKDYLNPCNYNCECPTGNTCDTIAIIIGPASFAAGSDTIRLCGLMIGDPKSMPQKATVATVKHDDITTEGKPTTPPDDITTSLDQEAITKQGTFQ